jgi:hypothetical protein
MKKLKRDDEELSKGDLIRTPQGYFAWVNWDNREKGMIGVQYVDCPGNLIPGLGCMTFPRGEVEVIKRGTKLFFEELFASLGGPSLEEAISAERAIRTKLPEEKVRVLRKKNQLGELLKELTDEELSEFIKIQIGKGGTQHG